MQEMTITLYSVEVEKSVYEYNADNTLKAVRYGYDGINFRNAEWYQYGDPDFPFLPVEVRLFEGTGIPPDYTYAEDLGNYRTDPTDEMDSKYIRTSNNDDQLIEMIEQSGDGWASSWVNFSRIIITYDPSGRVSRVDMDEWAGDSWMQFNRLDLTYNGSFSSIGLENGLFLSSNGVFPLF